ncbi:FkbM family methyltransferase [Oligoflexus sp.]|uniref:FkbM family methyltransferase n=1 Tax=Oligoflexus sp. TaxID=1971216 RepID=UPI002D771D1E|nr:FkbM family methyltransferase [Oligoflexus sp.]
MDRWSLSSGWPLNKAALRLLMLPLLPLYIWRLGLGQGLVTFYRFLLGEDGFVIHRSERDPGTIIRDDSTDAWVFQQIFILCDYRLLVGRSDVRVIIDAGAYVGFSSIYFAELYPHAFIYALEPEESNFQALQRNTRHYPNIKAIQAAVWKEDGFLEVKDVASGQWSFVVQEHSEGRGQQVPAISIQSLMEQYRLPRIDILKIDIEGAEDAVFEGPGCHTWLPKVRVLALELHDHLYPGSERNFLEAIATYECTVRTTGENIIFDFPELPEPGVLEAPRRRYS